MSTKRNISGLRPFKKGEDSRRNVKGQPRKLPELEILLADVLGEEKDGKTAAQAILMKLRQMATSGNVRAAEILLNRSYGLPKQPIDLKSTNKITLEIVRSTATPSE